MSSFVVAEKGMTYILSLHASMDEAKAKVPDHKGEHPNAEAMTWEDFETSARAVLLTGPVVVTEERWHDMLNVLPPMRWRTELGVETFCMCEYTWGNITDQFGRMGDKYIRKPVDMSDPSTFITAEDFKEAYA